jgi:hypothetical protein
MKAHTRRPTRATRVLVYALFAVVAVVTLWVPLYNRTEPTLGGIPFFYWFQVAWILVSAVATALAYKSGL